MGKVLGIEQLVGHELQPLALHLAAIPATDAPNLELERHPCVAARRVAHLLECLKASSHAALRHVYPSNHLHDFPKSLSIQRGRA
jgi:hypothetical protein